MEGISILQLTSLTTVVSASIFLTYMAKRLLAEVPVASKVPVWAYTAIIAAALTYIASRVTGTLEGQTGVLMLDAIINGALASGLREWFVTGTKPLEASGTARDAIVDNEWTRRTKALLLPLLLAGSLLATGACLPKAPPAVVSPTPTAEQVQALRNQAQVLATAVKEASALAVQAGRLADQAYAAGLIPPATMQKINQAGIDAANTGLAFVEFARTVTTEPSLRATVKALLSVFDDYIAALTEGKQGGGTIRLALEALRAYLGVEAQ